MQTTIKLAISDSLLGIVRNLLDECGGVRRCNACDAQNICDRVCGGQTPKTALAELSDLHSKYTQDINIEKIEKDLQSQIPKH